MSTNDPLPRPTPCQLQPPEPVLANDGSPERVRLIGIALRYLLVVTLWERGPARPIELVRWVVADGFEIPAGESKSVADALRWEVRRGRVVRLDRGLYGPGRAPASTEHRIRWQVRRLRAGLDYLPHREPLSLSS